MERACCQDRKRGRGRLISVLEGGYNPAWRRR